MFLYDHDIRESSKRLRPHGPTENRRICNVVPSKAAKFLKVSFLPIEIWLPGDVSLDQKLSIGAGTEAHFIWYPGVWDLFTGVPCEELIATGDYSKLWKFLNTPVQKCPVPEHQTKSRLYDRLDHFER